MASENNNIPKIAMVIGSTRATRFADKPADWLMEQAQSRADFSLDKVDLRDFDLPLFNEKASNLYMPSEDPKVIAWQDAIRPYAGYIFIVAEYNHTITAALNNALDQAYKEWVHKPFSALGYGSVGAARAIEHLRNIGVELQMVPSRFGAHIGGSDFGKVHPLGANGPISDIEQGLKPSVDAMFDDVVWWAKLLKDARAQA